MVSPGDEDYDRVSHDRGQVCKQVHQEEEAPQVLGGRKCLQNELLDGGLIFHPHSSLWNQSLKDVLGHSEQFTWEKRRYMTIILCFEDQSGSYLCSG